MPSLQRWVYAFRNGRADGSAAMRDILGGKGAGFWPRGEPGAPGASGVYHLNQAVLTYLETGSFPDELPEEIDRHLKQVEQATKRRFGVPTTRCSSPCTTAPAVSMPGMMETILDLG